MILTGDTERLGGKLVPVPRSPIYIHSVRTAQKTHSVSVIKTSHLMLHREIIAVCSEIYTKHTNTLCGQNVELLNVKLVVHIVNTGLYRVKKKDRKVQNCHATSTKL